MISYANTNKAVGDCMEILEKQESYSGGRNELLARIAVLLAVACDELEGIREAISAGKDDGK